MAAKELETLLHLIQDGIAPELRELKVRVAARKTTRKHSTTY